MNNTERRFHVEQDRSYEAEENSFTKRWSNTKVKMLKTYTVYEYVGSPAYQTPVFQGTKVKCEKYVVEQST